MYTIYLNLAKELALTAGQIMLQTEKVEVSEKSPSDFVTNVDLSIEKMVRERLAIETPDFGILGEEGANIDWSTQLDSEYCWVLDPLDGTTNFAFKIPHFAFSLALLHRRKSVVGVVYDPSRREMFYAEKGKGAFLNDKKINVADKDKLSNSILALGLPSTSKVYLEKNKLWFNHLLNSFMKFRSLGASALDLCWLALGRVDAFFQIDIKPWDVAAAAIICQEAGAVLVSLENEKATAFDLTSGSVFSSNQKLYKAFIDSSSK